MKLSTFITHNMEAIISEWEAVTRTLLPEASATSCLALRHHVQEILEKVTKHIDARDKESPCAAASGHGVSGHAAGFDLMQLGVEFRVLRASVIRLWANGGGQTDEAGFHEMLRFHEAIDQALAESMVRYVEDIERSRTLFIGMLAHDLRAPLSAISMSCQYLSRQNVSTDRLSEAVGRISRSADAMSGMIKELLDFARSRLGKEMPITRRRTDIGAVCLSALDDMRAAHPRCEFLLDVTGELVGQVDAARLHQLLWNLLNNAVQHGARGQPIILTARSTSDAVLLQVKNRGPVIPTEAIPMIFDPLVQFSTADADGGMPANLGLGLFIAHEITRAHGGEISVASSEQAGTVFTVRLPRTA